MSKELSQPSLPEVDQLASDLEAALAPALAAAVGSAIDDTSEAARQVIAGDGLPAGWRERLGDRPAVTLVSFDADRIQSWVFSSERVQVAGGASKRLDRINQQAGELAGRVEGVTGLVYSAGGGGMLFAEPQRDIEQLTNAVKAELERGADELTFTVEAIPLVAADLEPTRTDVVDERFQALRGVGGALVRSQVLVRRRKEEAPVPPAARDLRRVPGRPAERCPSCGLRPPRDGRPVTGDGPEFWCQPCLDRRRFWQADREPGEAVPTFEQFAEANRRGRPYLAFLAIDGNAMGNLVQGVRSFLELRAFSEATSAIFTAARDRVPGLLADGGFLADGHPPKDSYLSLLSGGDEITVVLPSSPAPVVALDLLRAIEAGYDFACRPDALLGQAFAGHPELLARLRRVGAAAGLVIAPGAYPVRLMRRYATELQKRAKRFCATPGDDASHRSGIAWKLLTDSSPLTAREALAGDADHSLAALANLLDETSAAAEEGVALSALRMLLDVFRREEESARSLPADAARETAARVTANFLRYQVARSADLDRWWRRVEPQGVEDGAFHRLRGGADELQGLLDLLSLQPVPVPGAGALQEVSS